MTHFNTRLSNRYKGHIYIIGSLSGISIIIDLCLFFPSVIRRMVSLLSTNATLEAEREAAMKQAASASRAAETLMNNGSISPEDKNVEEMEKKLKEAQEGKTLVTS